MTHDYPTLTEAVRLANARAKAQHDYETAIAQAARIKQAIDDIEQALTALTALRHNPTP